MRSNYIYTVCFNYSVAPLAVFTVKRESQQWAEEHCKKYGWEMNQLVRYRYNCINNGDRMQAYPCPLLDLIQYPSNPANCPIEDGDPRVKEIRVHD